MKTVYFLLLLMPLGVWAQSETLKPIEMVRYSEPMYTRYGYRPYYTTHYSYDGIEVRRPTELGKYILSSNDPNAIQEYRQFKSGRDFGTSLLVMGGVASFVGLIITASPKTVRTQDPLPASLANYNGPWYANGQVIYGNPYTSTEKKVVRQGGLATMSAGLSAILIGALIRRPGFHFRRSIQYYNKSLRPKDVSFKIEPHVEYTNSGIGLVARF